MKRVFQDLLLYVFSSRQGRAELRKFWQWEAEQHRQINLQMERALALATEANKLSLDAMEDCVRSLRSQAAPSI